MASSCEKGRETVKRGEKWAFGRIFWSALLAAELTVAVDMAAGIQLHPVTMRVLLPVWLGLSLALLLAGQSKKWRRIPALALPVLGIVAVAAGYLGWRSFSTNGVYTQVDQGKAAIYADHSVMVIVPHEDDDLNIAGGVVEEYIRYGSRVTMVFVTNGDAYGLSTRRLEEAIACCDFMGIPEEQVVFLGYGDQWAEGGPHLYNAPAGQTLTSAGGGRQTYGTQGHPAYREGRAYTSDNLLADMQALLLEYRPDTILCSDYDAHIDHKAVTLTFEKALGQILKQTPDYRPRVYKAFAYNTAWLAEADFAGENLKSTQNIFAPPYYQSPEIYRWQDRIRLPVAAGTLSRSLMSTANYRGMSIYASQNEKLRAARITNGDKIFWQRRTDSLCYDAQVEVSSGNGALLTDFMLLECDDLVGRAQPYDGVWTPDAGDLQPRITVTLPEKKTIDQIVLYDHPNKNVNILDAQICLEDGTCLRTGPLDPGGAATVIPLERTTGSFSVTLLSWEGEGAGLTEIEAYTGMAQGTDRFVKLMDGEGNFVYDYWVDSSGSQCFQLYTYGAGEAPSPGEFTFSLEGSRCSASMEDGMLTVTCPRGASCTVRLESTDGTLTDTVVLRNPGLVQRWLLKIFQTLEDRAYQGVRLTTTVQMIFRLRQWI